MFFHSVETMRPSSLLRTFSCKLPASFSHSPVTPWPPARSAFDRWLTSELDELRWNPFSLHRSASAAWLSKALDLAVAAQYFTAKSIAEAIAANSSAVDRKMIDSYLEDVVELLDACNGLRERMEAIKKYVDRLRIALHWLEGEHEPSETGIRRAREALGLCELMEKRCAELEKCRSNLRRLGEKLVAQNARPCEDMSNPIEQLHEVLGGSRMVALLVVGMLGIALSFKPRRGLPSVQSCKTASWMSSLHELQKEVKEEFDRRRRDGLVALDELDATAMAARSLPERISRRSRGELTVAVDVLKRRCEEMERRVWPLEGKVDELYRQLIGIRVSLLGMLTVAC